MYNYEKVTNIARLPDNTFHGRFEYGRRRCQLNYNQVLRNWTRKCEKAVHKNCCHFSLLARSLEHKKKTSCYKLVVRATTKKCEISNMALVDFQVLLRLNEHVK